MVKPTYNEISEILSEVLDDLRKADEKIHDAENKIMNKITRKI